MRVSSLHVSSRFECSPWVVRVVQWVLSKTQRVRGKRTETMGLCEDVEATKVMVNGQTDGGMAGWRARVPSFERIKMLKLSMQIWVS